MWRKLTLRERPWCCERLRAGGEGDDRGWHGWTASPIRWTWVWASSGSWWWIGKPGVLQFKGSQRIGHNCATELNSWPFTRVLQVDPPLSIGDWPLLFWKIGMNTAPCDRTDGSRCIFCPSMGKCSWDFMPGVCWQSSLSCHVRKGCQLLCFHVCTEI